MSMTYILLFVTQQAPQGTTDWGKRLRQIPELLPEKQATAAGMKGVVANKIPPELVQPSSS